VDEPALTLIGGQPLTADVARRLPQGVVVRLMVDQPAVRPVDVGDVVEVLPGNGARRGDTVLFAHDGRCELARLIRRAGSSVDIAVGPEGRRISLSAGAVLGVASALEQGDLLFDLSRGRWRAAGRMAAAFPAGMGPLLGFMARLERLRRPFFPPLFMGGEQQILDQLTEAYDVEAEIIGRETALLPEEQALLEGYLTRGSRLLDVGCGAGREAVGFARAGLSVVGIDVAPAMIDRARERAQAAGLAIEFVVGEPLTWPAPGAPFDAIYFSPGIYSHIPGRARRVRTLARLRGLLARGGLIVLGPILSPPLPRLSRTRLVDALRRVGRAVGVRRLAEPGDHYYRGHALERTPVSYRYVHRFRDGAEAEAELADAGLRVTDRLDETCWIARPAI
jgi:ubiquinone/menaquinone biosynthesis C-methylase UbiE